MVLAVAASMTFGFLVQDADPFLSVALPFVVLLPSWLIGDAVRQRRMAAQRRPSRQRRRQTGATRERDARVREAAAEERRRVARELHDVVAHGVSVMQSRRAQRVRSSGRRPNDAEEASAHRRGDRARSDGRAPPLLGVLDDDRAEAGPGLAPEPGVDQLDGLVDRVRAGRPPRRDSRSTAAAAPARRPRCDGLPDRPGGAHERASVCARCRRRWSSLTFEPGQLRIEILDDGPTVRTLRRSVTVPAAGWSACESAPLVPAVGWRPGRGSVAAMRSAPGCPSKQHPRGAPSRDRASVCAS